MVAPVGWQEVYGLSLGAGLVYVVLQLAQRNYKDEEEIRMIEESVDLSTEMHLAAYRTVRPGIHESQVAAAVEEVACRHGNALAFPTIATTQGQVLHNHGFIHTLKEGDIFLLDAGAETKMHYAGDLSSSMPVGERFTERQAEVYNIHLKSFYAAVDKLQLGVPFRDAHRRVGSFVKYCKEHGKALDEATLEEMRETIPEATPEFLTLFDPAESVRKRRLVGGTGFEPVAEQLDFWQKELKNV